MADPVEKLTSRLQLVSPDEPDEPTRRTFASGRISGRRSRHDERKRLLQDLRAAERWARREPWRYAARVAVERTAQALAAFDGREERVH